MTGASMKTFGTLHADRWLLYSLALLFLGFLLKTFIPGIGIGFFEITLLASLFVYFKCWNSLYFYKIVTPFLAFLIVLVVSTIVNFQKYDVNLIDSVYQFLTHLKILFFVGIFIFASRFDYSKNSIFFNNILLFLVVVNISVCIFQYFSPSLASLIMPGAVLDTYVLGTDWRRLTGIFYHPTPLSFFSSLVVIYSYFSIRSFFWKIFFIFSALVLLVFSGQRGEAVFLLFAIFLAEFFYRHVRFLSRWYFSIPFLLGFSLVAILMLLNSSEINDESIARLVIYKGGLELAMKEFPFGAGLSTFGSANSMNSVAYTDLGMDGLWWFKQEMNYITDTFWGMIFGESGYLGAIFYAVFVISFLSYFVIRGGGRMTLALCVFLFLEMFTNPIFTGSYAFLYMMFYMMLFDKNYYPGGVG